MIPAAGGSLPGTESPSAGPIDTLDSALRRSPLESALDRQSPERSSGWGKRGVGTMATVRAPWSMARVRNGVKRRLHDFGAYRGVVIRRFHDLYYDDGQRGRTWRDTYFLGVPIRKNPLDMWIYQEILYDVQPDLIIECGTLFGGSAYYLARLCDLLGKGSIVTIDIKERPGRPAHPRITYLTGSSTSDEIGQQVADRARDADTVLVILDSDHSRDHVLEELRRYSPFVNPGSYVIVEDTDINGHPTVVGFGPGPMEAVDDFLSESSEFEVDAGREKFLFSFNPRGYLRRREPDGESETPRS